MSSAPTRGLLCQRCPVLPTVARLGIATFAALWLFWQQSVILGQQLASRCSQRIAARARRHVGVTSRARRPRFGSSAAAALVAVLLAAFANVPFNSSPSLAAVPSSFEDSLVTQVPGPT